MRTYLKDSSAKRLLPAMVVTGLLFCVTAEVYAAGPGGGKQNRPPPAVPSATHRSNGNSVTAPVRGAHLGQWMQQHSNLSPEQQQRALENEPGFRSLPPGTQQTVMNRLGRLNTMPEPQRARVIQRNEYMERMTPEQRGDVRSAMGQLSALPVDRRRAVSRSFRELRGLSPEQRSSVMSSPQYQRQFTEEERGTLGNLLAVSPLLPPTQ